MKSFLRQIAEQYYTAYGKEISDFCFVFPNKRAGLFFKKELAAVMDSKTPIFAPSMLSINNLLLNYSDIKEAEHVTLLFQLYTVYKRVTQSDDTFDNFYAFGEMLLSDFNEVDTYLIDAHQIFTYISDLKEIDNQFSYFSAEQIEIIKRFWGHFLSGDEKPFKLYYLKMWQSLEEVYLQFKAALEARKIGYSGMIFRRLAERMKRGDDLPSGYKKMIFVGFNALNPIEKTVMSYFKKREAADFYFDYQSPLLKQNEDFVKQYIKTNQSAFPSQFTLEEEGRAEHYIEVVAVPSKIGQVKETYRILDKLFTEKNDEDAYLRTAVVLPDEQLLMPLLYSIPPQVDTVNVTMGFPLSQTPIAGFIQKVVDMQKAVRRSKQTETIYYKPVLALLRQPYVQMAAGEEVTNLKAKIEDKNLFQVPTELLHKGEFLTLLFSNCTTADGAIDYFSELAHLLENVIPPENKLDREFLFYYKKSVNLLRLNLEEMPMDLQVETVYKLLRQLVGSVRVPFEGEPLAGLQVMGMLETRLLDFDTVIIPSFNDDMLPRKQRNNSLIPYGIRKVFGLPTYEDSDAVFSYNFYRLLHRAKTVYLIYDSRNNKVKNSEISRFYYQLKYLYQVPMKERTVAFEIESRKKVPLSVPKQGEVQEKLLQYLNPNSNKMLSASSINDYINCPLSFYFGRVLGLSEQDEMSEMMEANTFGSIFHEVMQDIYKPYKNEIITKVLLSEIIKNDYKIESCLMSAFAKHYFKRANEKIEMTGYSLLMARIIKKYVLKTLHFDKQRAPFTFLEGEQNILTQISLPNGQKVNVKVIIDRVDEKDGLVHIIDYKTGKVTKGLTFDDMAELFTASPQRPKEIMQTFLYSMIYTQQYKKEICPNVYSFKQLKDLPDISFSYQKEEILKYSTVAEEYERLLKSCLEKLFDKSVPFTQTEDVENCKYCPFIKICRR
ncbi:MAG TPA: PD-(D/E)XK nuclease family protein [Paludibacteraceae bacterium]|mgnify:FL=1|nr:PD-(D/E)XK nuclease family protein [Paludibacteraceae bacterium]